jgi:hypothetical protein
MWFRNNYITKFIIMKRLLFLIFFLPCTGILFQTDEIGVLDLLSDPSTELKSLSEIATDVTYVPLQTSENSLIGHIQEIRTINGKFYIFTFREVLCFDKTGHYLYKLHKEGKGPEEYTSIYDFDVSSDNDLLIILVDRKIFVYKDNGSSFIFSKSLKFNDQPSKTDFVPGQKNILLSYFSPSGNEPFRNVLINLNGDTLNLRLNHYKYKLTKNIMFGMAYDNLNYEYNNKIHFKEMLSDTVFVLDQKNNIRPYFILDSRGKNLTTEALANYSRDQLPNYLTVRNMMEVSRYIIYTFYYNKATSFGFYDKVSNKKLGVNGSTFLQDDIIGGVNFEPKYSYDGKLYGWVDALALKKHLSNDNFKRSVVKNPEKKKAFEKMVDSLNETDNPVLIVVTPKK